MKLYDSNGNYQADIEKPDPIEQDGKWWEFIEYRTPKEDEYYQRPGCLLHQASYDYDDAYWIASEIPRASPEQLKAICLPLRPGAGCPRRISLALPGEVIEAGDEYKTLYEESWHFSLEIGKTVPSNSSLIYRRKTNNTPKQPPQKEPKFSVEEIKTYLGQFCTTQMAIDLIDDPRCGIAALTEMMRNEGKM